MSAPQPPPYPVIALVAGALALLALFRFFVRLRRDRLVADTPAMRMRSAAQGYVKVNGRAEPAGPAPTGAPLSLRPCVWWDYEIAQEERDSKGNTRWNTVERASSVELFTLVDDGRCALPGGSGVGRSHPHRAQRLVRLWAAPRRAAPRTGPAAAPGHLALHRAAARCRRAAVRHGRAALAFGGRRRSERRHRREAARVEAGPGGRCWRASISTTTASSTRPNGKPRVRPRPGSRRRRRCSRRSPA